MNHALDGPRVDASRSLRAGTPVWPGDQGMTAHGALDRRGMPWIEGLWLGRIGPGPVQMIALPLPQAGAEAAPIRVLIKEES